MYPYKDTFRMTSPRGYRTLYGENEYHKGIDLVGNDKNIYCVADGIVEYAGYENPNDKKQGFGLYIRERLPDGRRIYYAHLQSVAVKTGESVPAGKRLGVEGDTGRVTGRHLHLELRGAGLGKDSLDICEFIGIENKVGTYFIPVTDPNEIVYVLGEFGIVEDKAGMLAEMEREPNGRVYHLARKTVDFFRKVGI